MEEENEAILIAMIIGATILGIGLAMFFNRPYTGYGAVVLAIGLMTLSLIITMRAEEIINLKIYPTAARSETISEVSVENQSPKEPASPPSAETQAQEVLEPREPYEVQIEQAPEVQEVEEAPQPSQEAEQIQEVEETEQPYTPSVYEPEQEEERKPEPEYEPDPSIEAAPSYSE